MKKNVSARMVCTALAAKKIFTIRFNSCPSKGNVVSSLRGPYPKKVTNKNLLLMKYQRVTDFFVEFHSCKSINI